MAEAGTCSVTRTTIGKQFCIKGNPLKMARKPFLVVPGFTFDTFADFQDQDVWNAAIAAGNIFPLELIEAVENSSVEASIVDTDGGSKFKTRKGRYGYIYDMNMTLSQNANAQDLDSATWTIIVADDDDNLIGTTPDGTVVGGLDLSYLDVMDMQPTGGTDDYSKTRIEIQLKYNIQLNEQIMVALGSDLDWSPKQLDPVTTVTISNVSIAAFVITASFNIVDNTIASRPTVTIRTLTPDDLVVIDEGGSVVTLTQPDIVETSTPGIWDITTSAMVSGTIQQVATATSLFESAETAVTA